MDNKGSNINRFLVYLFFASFVMFGVVAYFSYTNFNQTDDVPEQLEEVAEAPKGTGVLTLITTTDKARVGSPVSVKVQAHSDGREVVGYDVLLDNSKKLYRVSSVTSDISDFQVFYSEKKPGLVSITGIKKSDSKSQTLFNNDPVLTVVLVPNQQGQLPLTILESLDNEKTDIVTSDTKPIYPSLNNTSVEVN